MYEYILYGSLSQTPQSLHSSVGAAVSAPPRVQLQLPAPLSLRPPLRPPLQIAAPVTVPMIPLSRSAAQLVSEGLLTAGVSGMIVRPAMVPPASEAFHHNSYNSHQTASSYATYFSRH